MESPFEKLFWGLVLKHGEQYKQTPAFNFHVSMAVLDLKTAENDNVSVHVQVENGEFIICNLSKTQPQVNLDLIFSEGEKIKFYTAGKGNVHLTGYTMPDDLGMGLEDESEFSDEASIDSEVAGQLPGGKRKNTETLKLTGKDAKKLKTNEGKAVEATAKQSKIVDVDPKQLLNDKKSKQDNKPEQQKKGAPQQQANQKKQQPPSKLATKDLQVDSEASDDDLSIDEDEESLDLNQLNRLADEEDSGDELGDDDLESDDDDLESDDEEVDVAKLNAVKKQLTKQQPQQAKTQQAAGAQKGKPSEKPQQQGNKANQQKPHQNGQQMNKHQHNKSPQQYQNKGNLNSPHNKSFQKNNQTPFNKNNQNSNKKHTPFQQNKNKSFGSQNKSFGSQNKSFGSQNKGKKVFN